MLWSQVLREQPGDPAMVTRALDGLDQAARLQIRMIDTLLTTVPHLAGTAASGGGGRSAAAHRRERGEASRPLAATKAITLEMDLAGGLIAVSGDATRLGQVIWHLLSNAIRHTPPRGGRGGYASAGARGVARVTVRDSGPGIESSRLSTIFDLHHASARGGPRSTTRAGWGWP